MAPQSKNTVDGGFFPVSEYGEMGQEGAWHLGQDIVPQNTFLGIYFLHLVATSGSFYQLSVMYPSYESTVG